MFLEKTLIKLFDCTTDQENPIGKSNTKKQFIEMLQPYFIVEETYLHFFLPERYFSESLTLYIAG